MVLSSGYSGNSFSIYLELSIRLSRKAMPMNLAGHTTPTTLVPLQIRGGFEEFSTEDHLLNFHWDTKFIWYIVPNDWKLEGGPL